MKRKKYIMMNNHRSNLAIEHANNRNRPFQRETTKMCSTRCEWQNNMSKYVHICYILYAFSHYYTFEARELVYIAEMGLMNPPRYR